MIETGSVYHGYLPRAQKPDASCDRCHHYSCPSGVLVDAESGEETILHDCTGCGTCTTSEAWEDDGGAR